jgi:hypothetical protein
MRTIPRRNENGPRTHHTPGPLPLAWLVIAAIAAGIGGLAFHETGSSTAAIATAISSASALYALLRKR